MKKSLLSPLLILLLLLVGFTGCSDDSSSEEPAVDTTPPIITITSPTDGATVKAGSEVMVSGTIKEESELESVTVNVSSLLYNDSRTINKADLPPKENDIYRLEQPYPVPVIARGTFNVEVIALDNQGLISKESFDITVVE